MFPTQRPRPGPHPINNFFRVTKPSSRSQSTFAGTKSSQLSVRQVTSSNERPVEAIDLTEAGPKQRDLEFFRSPARGQLSFPRPRPVQNVTRRRDDSDLTVPEEMPKILGEFILQIDVDRDLDLVEFG